MSRFAINPNGRSSSKRCDRSTASMWRFGKSIPSGTSSSSSSSTPGWFMSGSSQARCVRFCFLDCFCTCATASNCSSVDCIPLGNAVAAVLLRCFCCCFRICSSASSVVGCPVHPLACSCSNCSPSGSSVSSSASLKLVGPYSPSSCCKGVSSLCISAA